MILYDSNGQPLSDPFEDALEDMGASASIMVTLYKDGTITADFESNGNVYPDGLPVIDALKMLNEAGKIVYESSDDEDELQEAFDGQE